MLTNRDCSADSLLRIRTLGSTRGLRSDFNMAERDSSRPPRSLGRCCGSIRRIRLGISTANQSGQRPVGIVLLLGVSRVPPPGGECLQEADTSGMVARVTVGIAQLVRAPDCGSGGRGFESPYPPLFLLTSRCPHGRSSCARFASFSRRPCVLCFGRFLFANARPCLVLVQRQAQHVVLKEKDSIRYRARFSRRWSDRRAVHRDETPLHRAERHKFPGHGALW